MSPYSEERVKEGMKGRKSRNENGRTTEIRKIGLID